jgi:hypothetical protein
MTELCSCAALRVEGGVMRHCVVTYASACRAGACSIWSMRVVTPEGRRHVLTIEVDPRQRRILQVRRKCNARPMAQDVERVRRWAQSEGVEIGEAALA